MTIKQPGMVVVYLVLFAAVLLAPPYTGKRIAWFIAVIFIVQLCSSLVKFLMTLQSDGSMAERQKEKNHKRQDENEDEGKTKFPIGSIIVGLVFLLLGLWCAYPPWGQR